MTSDGDACGIHHCAKANSSSERNLEAYVSKGARVLHSMHGPEKAQCICMALWHMHGTMIRIERVCPRRTHHVLVSFGVLLTVRFACQSCRHAGVQQNQPDKAYVSYMLPSPSCHQSDQHKRWEHHVGRSVEATHHRLWQMS